MIEMVRLLLEDRSSYSLIAILDKKMTTDPDEPNHVVNIEKTASELSKYIDLKESDIKKILKDGEGKKKNFKLNLVRQVEISPMKQRKKSKS